MFGIHKLHKNPQHYIENPQHVILLSATFYSKIHNIPILCRLELNKILSISNFVGIIFAGNFPTNKRYFIILSWNPNQPSPSFETYHLKSGGGGS